MSERRARTQPGCDKLVVRTAECNQVEWGKLQASTSSRQSHMACSEPLTLQLLELLGPIARAIGRLSAVVHAGLRYPGGSAGHQSLWQYFFGRRPSLLSALMLPSC